MLFHGMLVLSVLKVKKFFGSLKHFSITNKETVSKAITGFDFARPDL